MSTRLSPAASLLRNSKLFALPPQIALPTAPPSSDVVSGSDTATTVYPQYAAIETTPASGAVGDWGFKRPLPLKTVRNTKNPVVRLVRGIDTPEHIADFESAADHVLNLRKFQALDHPLRLPHWERERTGATAHDRSHCSVFRATHDNTTNLSSNAPAYSAPTGIWPNIASEAALAELPEKIRQLKMAVEEQKKEQDRAAGVDPMKSGAAMLEQATTRAPREIKPKRWRYAGPSLVRMSGQEFDDYVHNLGEKEKSSLVDRIRQNIRDEKMARARDEGKVEEQSNAAEVTDQEITDYLRYLRNEPKKFGPIITEMLDIPEGDLPGSGPANRSQKTDYWEYGRDTLAAPSEWKARGPPKTHPSAGLSYLQTTAHTTNHSEYGPQKHSAATLARVIKTKHTNSGTQANYGLAGFVVQHVGSGMATRPKSFEPKAGGAKIVARPGQGYIKEDGTLKMAIVHESEQDYAVGEDKPMFMAQMRREEHARLQEMGSRQASPMPQMSSPRAYQPRPPRRFQAKTEGVDILDQLSSRRP